VIRLDAGRGIYTQHDVVELLGKLFPALELPAYHVELVAPEDATVPYEAPVESRPPKSEVEELRDLVAANQAEMAELRELLKERKPRKPIEPPERRGSTDSVGS
jgi:hypothetical protein